MYRWNMLRLVQFVLFCVIAGTISCSGEINQRDEAINLAVVACGDRLKETIVLLKSALMFTQTYLHFIIVTEPDLKNDFLTEVDYTLYNKMNRISKQYFLIDII